VTVRKLWLFVTFVVLGGGMLTERAAAAAYGTQFVLFERLPAQGTPVACGLKFAEFVPVKDGNDDAALSVLGSVMVQ
jgi:hypothetical protein